MGRVNIVIILFITVFILVVLLCALKMIADDSVLKVKISGERKYRTDKFSTKNLGESKAVGGGSYVFPMVCECVLSDGEDPIKCMNLVHCPRDDGNGNLAVFKDKKTGIRYYNPLALEGKDLVGLYENKMSIGTILMQSVEKQLYMMDRIYLGVGDIGEMSSDGLKFFNCLASGGGDNIEATYYFVMDGMSEKELVYNSRGEFIGYRGKDGEVKWVSTVSSNEEGWGMKWMLSLVSIIGCSNVGLGDGIDSGVDSEEIRCGVGRYPSFDEYCRGNAGCKEMGGGVDGGCYCGVCEDEKCVEIRCIGGGRDIGELGRDIKDAHIDVVVDESEDVGGKEVEEVEDVWGGSDIREVGVIDVRIPEEEYICKEPGDPEGVEFEGDLDEGITYIGVTYEYAVIRGDYIIWLSPDEGDIYYLSLVDRKVRRVPNCDKVKSISWLTAEVDRIYWKNFIRNNKGKVVEVMFYYNIPRKEIRILSPMDTIGNPYPYKNTLFFTVHKSEEYFLYYKDVENYDYRVIEYSVLDKIMDLGIGGIGGYYFGLWENLLVYSRRQSIITVNLDTLEKKEVFVYDTDDDINMEIWGVCYGPVFIFDKGISRDKGPYGHYTTDVFYIDLRDYRVVRVTDDEVLQFGATSYYDDKYKLLVYYENYDPKLSDYGGGYLVVYDIETGVRRRIPGVEGDIMVVSMYGAKVLVDLDRGFYVYRFALVDLEKLGIVKDGHVVPE